MTKMTKMTALKGILRIVSSEILRRLFKGQKSLSPKRFDSKA